MEQARLHQLSSGTAYYYRKGLQDPNEDSDMEIVWIGNIYDPSFSTGHGGGVYNPNGIAPTVKSRDYKDPTLVIVWK